MHLARFRVRMFRSVIDSGDVPVFPLTALLGRRRSGKSTLLRVLAAMHPDAAEGFSLDRDWPRDRRPQRSPEQIACEVEYAVEEAEAEEVGRAWGGADRPGKWILGRDYRDEFHAWTVSADGQQFEGRPATAERLRRWLPSLVHLDGDALISRDTLARANLGELGSVASRRDDRTLLALLACAGLDPAELAGGSSAARLEEANSRLAEELEPIDLSRRIAVACEQGRFDVVIRAGRREDVPLDRAPKELLWRGNLEILLAAARRSPSEAVTLLLDGPGRWLRNEGGAFLRRCLAEYTKRCGPVIYTARLPFEMDLQHPEQVLVLAPGREGPVVARDFAGNGASNPDLRAALGMTGRTSFRVAELNLVVEGQIDAELLLAWSDLLERSGESGLPRDLNLIRAGGSYEVSSAAIFLARQGLATIALFDSDHAGRQAHADLRREAEADARVRRVAPLLLGEAAGLSQDEAAIEDLYPRADYLDAARRITHGNAADRALRRLAGSENGKVARQAQHAFPSEDKHFPKTEVAERLRDDLDALSSTDALPSELHLRVQSLMSAIRAAAQDLARD